MREQINNYKNALQWLSEDRELYDEVDRIRGTYLDDVSFIDRFGYML